MSDDIDQPVSSAAFAVLIGVSRQRVDQLIAAGTLSRGATCREWLLGYCENLRDLAVAGNDAELTKQRRRLAKTRADLADHELAKLRGDFVRKQAVIEHWGRMAASIRARLLLLPPTVAPLVSTREKADETRAILEKYVYEALTEIADGGAPNSSRGDATGTATKPKGEAK